MPDTGLFTDSELAGIRCVAQVRQRGLSGQPFDGVGRGGELDDLEEGRLDLETALHTLAHLASTPGNATDQTQTTDSVAR